MIILAHPEDEACERRLRSALAGVIAPVVVLVVSADALADDGIWAAAQDALKTGTLRLVLWRPCVVDELDRATLSIGADRKVSRLSWRAPLVYPTSGQWIHEGADMTAALDDLVRDLRK
mgnify:FL=1